MRLNLPTALLLTVSLAACGGSEDPAVPTAAPGTSTDAPAPVATDPAVTEADAALPPMPTGDFRITSLTLGKAVDGEGQVRAPLDRFAPTDKIFAAVTSVGSSDGLTLEARWSAADGTDVAKAGQSLSPSTPTVTTFSISQPQPWPAGAYQLTISINGRAVETRSFTVQ